MFRNMKKKHGCEFLFQNLHEVQKMFEMMMNTTVKCSPKSEKKTIRHNFSNYMGARPPYTLVFVGASTSRSWMKVDWNSSQLILAFFNQILILIRSDFWNFRHFIFYDFDTNFTDAFFHDSINFLTFYPL